jgi:hypothetical protein
MASLQVSEFPSDSEQQQHVLAAKMMFRTFFFLSFFLFPYYTSSQISYGTEFSFVFFSQPFHQENKFNTPFLKRNTNWEWRRGASDKSACLASTRP